MQSSGGSGSRSCVSCGRPISFDANVCPYCGHDYRVVMAGAPAQKKESAMPLAGGILILIGSIIYFAVGGLAVAGGTIASSIDLEEGSAWAIGCGAVIVVLGVVSVLGGIFAIGRKNFALAIIGGVLTIPTILGLIGLILVAVSKDEFTS
jgi:DNA-directed RNA polymerase subunit RPC12/RpoP